MIANKRHHCILLLWIGGSSEHSVCCSNRCLKHMCIVMDTYTHCCAWHYNVHCVSAVNQDRSIPVQIWTLTHRLRAFLFIILDWSYAFKALRVLMREYFFYFLFSIFVLMQCYAFKALHADDNIFFSFFVCLFSLICVDAVNEKTAAIPLRYGCPLLFISFCVLLLLWVPIIYLLFNFLLFIYFHFSLIDSSNLD